MPGHEIDVDVYPVGSEEVLAFEDVNYLSLVNKDTFGIPALIKEAPDGTTILYVNPENVVAIDATKKQ